MCVNFSYFSFNIENFLMHAYKRMIPANDGFLWSFCRNLVSMW